jgi:inosine/xanthosine triphosphatase
VTILVGSTRPAKVEGARDAITAIARVDPRFLTAVLEPIDLTVIAPRMPMNAAEIVDGARRRATALLERGPAFVIGLEGGLEHISTADTWTLQSWAAVSDGIRWGYGAGPSLGLPSAVAARVVAGEELGDVVDHMAGETVRGTRGAWGLLTRDLIGRRDAFRLAVLAAFAPFYNPSMW